MSGRWIQAARGSAAARREHYREIIPLVFAATAELYDTHWGEFFHLAVFEPGDDPQDFAAALARTHAQYFDAIGGPTAGRILELGTGGGAFAEWMADRTSGDVVGIDLAEAQLARARPRLSGRATANLRFVQHDAMCIDELDGPPFDAAVCLDAACYFPDRAAVLRGVATQLRPGARLLLVDWCRADRPSSLQEEMILEPLYRYWGIPEMETFGGYQCAFEGGAFRLLESRDLSERVRPNWERAYAVAQRALTDTHTPAELLRVTAGALRCGADGVRVLKEQFYAAVFAKAAADAGLLRYGYFLAERH